MVFTNEKKNYIYAHVDIRLGYSNADAQNKTKQNTQLSWCFTFNIIFLPYIMKLLGIFFISDDHNVFI